MTANQSYVMCIANLMATIGMVVSINSFGIRLLVGVIGLVVVIILLGKSKKSD